MPGWNCQKNQANVENYSHSSSTLSSKNSRYSKKLAKEQVCLYSWGYMINHNENENTGTNTVNKKVFSVWWCYVLCNN